MSPIWFQDVARYLPWLQKSGGGWDHENLLVADWDQIENAEHVTDIHPKRFHYKEIEVKLKNGKFVFPLADGTLRQPGSDRHRNSSSRRHAKGDLLQDDEDVEERVDTDEEEEAKSEEVREPAASQPEETEPADAPKDFGVFLAKLSIFIMYSLAQLYSFPPTRTALPL